MGEGESLYAGQRRIPPPTVIPAQAGIQNPGRRGRVERAGAWIPACAGMTMRGAGFVVMGGIRDAG